MKVTTQMVEETADQMHKYRSEHYGVPNGEDYPEISAAIAASEKVMMDVLVSSMIIGMSGGELSAGAKSLEGIAESEKTRALCIMVSKSGCFQPFAEAMYLGYLLGKRAHEIEKLESIT